MKKSIISGLFLGFISVSLFADVPVVDHSFSVSSNAREHIDRLERQVHNINEQNLLNRIEELQQEVREIKGKNEFWEYQIEQLNKQLKEFYRDLDQRLEKVEDTYKKGIVGDVVKPGLDRTLLPITTENVTSDSTKVVQEEDVVTVPIKESTKKEDLSEERKMYKAAVYLLPEKKHESKSKLRAYLKQYPKGSCVADVHYWLGEINFLQKEFDAAEEEFKIVVDKYSSSRRVPTAMLKLALVHRNQGKEAQAKKELNGLIKRYPNTSVSRLAKEQLKVK